MQNCMAHAPTTVAITIINVEEQFSGWYTRLRIRRRSDPFVAASKKSRQFTPGQGPVAARGESNRAGRAAI
jgi:hypothetical protein